jgi:hypothetical protein
MGCLACALLAAIPAFAQRWDRIDAIACLPCEFDQIMTSLCVYVGCEAGEAPRLGLGLQQVPLPPETPVRIAVDGQEVATFVLPISPGSPGRAVPLAGQAALLDALWLGCVAQVGLGTVEGWRDYEVQLSGAGEAIYTALAACLVAGETKDKAVRGAC